MEYSQRFIDSVETAISLLDELEEVWDKDDVPLPFYPHPTVTKLQNALIEYVEAGVPIANQMEEEEDKR